MIRSPATYIQATASKLAAVLLFCAMPLLFPPPAQAVKNDIPLQDCVKCHYTIVRQVKREGRAHRDKVTCKDCHRGHPPADTGVIPKCNRCHQGRSHFALANCLQCHQAHRPLRIRLPHRVTQPCLTCHTEQYAQLTANPSIHTKLQCTACHNVHGRKPPCSQCHGKHSTDPAMAKCTGCHAAHKPLAVEYADQTPATVCATCHEEVYQQLRASNAKHKDFSCAFCHRRRHRTIPRCQMCHEEPHWPALHQKFPRCGTCHGIAHDLII
ncbi:MAG TPA: cytochrome C [Desulfobacterales bacterium]|nr:cytochrome C [Desulfobacterales bacterium]